MRRFYFLITLLLIGVLALSACASGGSPTDSSGAAAPSDAAADTGADTASDTTSDAAATEPQTGGVLTAAISADPQGFDPHLTSAYSSFEVLENVFDTLVSIDENLNITPSLAESWEVSEDGLTWTFKLQEGITFHDGSDLTAEDVKFSYERILDPDVGSGASWRLANVESIEAVDDYTVAITLNAPYPGLLAKLAGYKGMAIVSSEAEDLERMPIGTGPFMFVEYVPGDHVTLMRNENYWETDAAGNALPYLDEVVFRPIPDETVKTTNLQTGEVDWVDSLPPQQVNSIADAGDVMVDVVTGGDYWYLGVNLNREPLGDPLVRQAINYAINKEDVAAAARWDTAVASDNPIPAESAWNSGYAPYEYNPERAKELLAEAGYADGFEVELMPSSQYEETVRAAQVVQAQLADVGVTATIRTLEWGTWLEEQGAGNFDIYVGGWIGNIDPDDYFYAQHHTGEIFNFTGYSNEALDALLDEGRAEADPDVRKGIYDQVAQILIDDSPYVYMYIPATVNAWQPNVHGVQARPDSAIRFKNAWMSQ